MRRRRTCTEGSPEDEFTPTGSSRRGSQSGPRRRRTPATPVDADHHTGSRPADPAGRRSSFSFGNVFGGPGGSARRRGGGLPESMDPEPRTPPASIVGAGGAMEPSGARAHGLPVREENGGETVGDDTRLSGKTEREQAGRGSDRGQRPRFAASAGGDGGGVARAVPERRGVRRAEQAGDGLGPRRPLRHSRLQTVDAHQRRSEYTWAGQTPTTTREFTFT
jgi:hypothetical protein